MSISDSLFGSGEGGTSTTTSSLSQEPYLKDLFSRARIATAKGPSVKGQKEGDLAAAQAYRDFAGSASGQLDAARQAQNFLLTQSLDPATNPNLQKYLDVANQSLATQYQQNVVPGLTGNAVAAGNVGSSRQGVAQGLAAQGLQQSQGQATSGILQGAYGQGLQGMVSALSATPGLVNAGSLAPQALQTAGNLQGSAENADYQGQLSNLQNYLSLIGGNYGGTTKDKGPGTQTGGISDWLGLAADALAVYGAYAAL